MRIARSDQIAVNPQPTITPFLLRLLLINLKGVHTAAFGVNSWIEKPNARHPNSNPTILFTTFGFNSWIEKPYSCITLSMKSETRRRNQPWKSSMEYLPSLPVVDKNVDPSSKNWIQCSSINPNRNWRDVNSSGVEVIPDLVGAIGNRKRKAYEKEKAKRRTRWLIYGEIKHITFPKNRGTLNKARRDGTELFRWWKLSYWNGSMTSEMHHEPFSPNTCPNPR